MKEAVKLARFKPSKNQTRNDLLVYGGWLTSRWEWSRDIDISLDDAIASARRLGEDVKIVGNPSPADRKKVRGKKRPPVQQNEPLEERLPKPHQDLPTTETKEPPPIEAPPVEEEAGSPEPSGNAEPPVEAEVQEPPTRDKVETPIQQPSTQAETGPKRPQHASLLLQRFFIAAALCSLALFLGYYRLAGSVYVSILLMADAFFIVATSIIAIRDRWGFGGKNKSATVNARDAPQAAPRQ